MNNYILELDEDQLKYISKALDFYVRIQTGQLSELSNPYMVTLPNTTYLEVDKKIKELKSLMFKDLPEDSYYSIRSKYISDEIRQILDIFEVIRYQFLLNDLYNNDIEKERYFKPRHWSSEKKLPIIQVKNIND